MLSVDDVMSAKPCWSRQRVEAVFDGRERLGLDDLWTLDIPNVDKVWVLCKFSRPHRQYIREQATEILRVMCAGHLEYFNDWLRSGIYQYDQEIKTQIPIASGLMCALSYNWYSSALSTLAHLANAKDTSEWMFNFLKSGVSDAILDC